jgi:hypothetical protein
MKLGKMNILAIGLILLFIFAFSGIDKTFAQQQFIRGDVDGDCLVGVLDIDFFICWYYYGGPSFPCWDAADVNDDGVVDASDMVYLLQYVFIPGAPPPPPPFPMPGPDPTPDGLSCANVCVAPAPSNLDSLIVPFVSGSVGDTITVPIVVRNNQVLLGYQIHLEFDQNMLQAIDVDTSGTATGVADPEWFWFGLGTGNINIECIVDCGQLQGVLPGRDTLVMIKFKECSGATFLGQPIHLWWRQGLPNFN